MGSGKGINERTDPCFFSREHIRCSPAMHIWLLGGPMRASAPTAWDWQNFCMTQGRVTDPTVHVRILLPVEWQFYQEERTKPHGR